MNKYSNLVAFLIELGKRFTKESPLFFKIIKWIGFVAATIVALPNILNLFNVHVPTAFSGTWDAIVITAGYTMAAISQLTVNRAPDGSVAGDKKVLPFTAQNELPPINKVTNKK